MDIPAHVAVVGGGISGLATAYYLRKTCGESLTITVLEESDRLGGKIATQSVAGHTVDTGPDALLMRSPQVAALIDELGLTDQLVRTAAQGSYVWTGNRLRRIPGGTLFGVPNSLATLLKSRMLSPVGLARAAFDLVLPASRVHSEDPSIGQIVRPRLGNEAFERLVAPLLGGVYAGDADELSARSTVPEIDALARNNRSLYLGLRRMRRSVPGGTGGSTLATTRQGLGAVVAELVARVGDGNIRRNSTVTGVVRTREGFRLDVRDARTEVMGPSIVADEVVLAMPAFVTAQLLASTAPAAAAVLAEMPYADVATVTLAYRRTSLTRPLDGTGFLVPPSEGRLLVGCSWSSAKWPHLGDANVAIIRCMVGRANDSRFTSIDDDTLVRRVHEELVAAMGVDAEPIDARVQRWVRGMPQYVVGHRGRIDAAGASVAAVPGLSLVGAAYHGVGVASCIVDAERTAQEIAHRLDQAAIVEGAAS